MLIWVENLPNGSSNQEKKWFNIFSLFHYNLLLDFLQTNMLSAKFSWKQKWIQFTEVGIYFSHSLKKIMNIKQMNIKQICSEIVFYNYTIASARTVDKDKQRWRHRTRALWASGQEEDRWGELNSNNNFRQKDKTNVRKHCVWHQCSEEENNASEENWIEIYSKHNLIFLSLNYYLSISKSIMDE